MSGRVRLGKLVKGAQQSFSGPQEAGLGLGSLREDPLSQWVEQAARQWGTRGGVKLDMGGALSAGCKNT